MPSPSFVPPGVVYLVGAGPGAPDLITVRGRDLLRRAGAVIYDALLDPALLNEAPANAERIFAGKRAGHHAMPQEEINELLRRKAYEHAVVVRLKGGDPFVFGRGGEELAHLRAAGVPVEIVPGVTSAIAAASVANVPLTQRRVSNSFAVVSGSSSPDATDEPPWHALAQIDTLVILMGLKKIGQVTQQLIAAGRASHTPAMIVCAATLPHQQIVVGTLETLEQLADAVTGDAPATIVVGEVVSLAQTPLYSNREGHGSNLPVSSLQMASCSRRPQTPDTQVEPASEDVRHRNCYDRSQAT